MSENAIDIDLGQELDALKAGDRLRSLKELGTRSGKWIHYEGRRMLNLSSNDYMGYAADEDMVAEFQDQASRENFIDDFGPGSSASRLLSGNHPGYKALEDRLEDLYGKPGLVFSSGYHANIGILPAVANRGDLILVDRLAHASILDGIRLAEAEWQRYRHLDMVHLRAILEKKRSKFRRVFVVTESVFSMDGDLCDLRALVELKDEFGLVLYVDEAHAVGARGTGGLGLAEEAGAIADVDLLVGTFGKALGGMGAFLICSDIMKRYLVNVSRPLIFTTALPPVIVNWNRWILEKMHPDIRRRECLSRLASRLRTELGKKNIPTAGASHIVPAIMGENHAAVSMAAKLRDRGFLVFAIRPPTVPANSARLRFSLSANMEWDDLSGICDGDPSQ